MSDHETTDTDDATGGDDEANSADQTFEAAEYADGTVTYPPHTVSPNGAERVGTVDLREYQARVVTWTTSTATPPGVREPNTLAIVEFDMGEEYDGPVVRALGQVAPRGDADDAGESGGVDDAGDVDVDIGDRVEPVYADDLREPGAGIREPESQAWDGFRFRPVE